MSHQNPGVDAPGRRTLLGLAAGASTAFAGCSGLASDPTVDGSETTRIDDSESARIEVPENARIDDPVDVVATGLPATTEVRIGASTTNPVDSTEWTASVTVETDADGRVDLREATPDDGAYEPTDGMGLFWSMRTNATRSEAWFPLATHEVTLAVHPTDAPTRTNGTATDSLATAATTRRLPDPETASLDDGLVGTIHYPDADTAPAVVVLHGSGGVEPAGTARLLAGHGYVAASVQYFGSPDPLADSLTEVPVEYVGETVRRLREDDRVTDAPVGLHGVSKGGELALLAGAHVDGVGAVVSVSGSGVVWEGLDENDRAAGTSSWTTDGDPVPYVEMPDYWPGSVREYYGTGLDEADAAVRANATIPVERITGPVTLVSGRDDGLWNAERFQRIAADRRREADGTVRHERYDDAGHSIRPPVQPTYGRSTGRFYEFGGTPAGNARAARSYWKLALETFDAGLRD